MHMLRGFRIMWVMKHTATVHRRLFWPLCHRPFHSFVVNRNKDEPPYNEAEIPMLNKSIHSQIFGPETNAVCKTHQKIAIEHLTNQEIWGKKSTEPVSNINLNLPRLEGRSISEHFFKIGLQASEPYLEKAKAFSKAILRSPRGIAWVRQPGWTKYTEDKEPESVPYPDEEMLSFDVEVLANDKAPESDVSNQYPIIACAASPTAWYTWISPRLTNPEKEEQELIPMGPGSEPRIIIGHNVGFDRARILEEYRIEGTANRFLDTMSLHIAVAGLCSQQRPEWILKDKSKKLIKTNKASDDHDKQEAEEVAIMEEDFYDVSSLNNLKQVVEFYCNHKLEKQQRDLFFKGSLTDIQENFEQLVTYCAEDVFWTHKVYKAVFPQFLTNCPHPVSFAGMLNMGSSFLTVNESWEKYIQNAEAKHQELEQEVCNALKALAEEAVELRDDKSKIDNDEWLKQLDWTVLARQRKLPGFPKWYRDNYDKYTDTVKITVRSRIAPLLFKLKWLDYPLYFIQDKGNKKIVKSHGWCFKVPVEKVDIFRTLTPVKSDDTHYYFKLPHKDGDDAACGTPIAKGYLSYFEEGKLTSEYSAAKRALELNAKSAYWISSRERIKSQFVIWDKITGKVPETIEGENANAPASKKLGIILPQLIPMGTITRRAVEKTWLTASNAKANRIGSELKAMVQAPAGYKFVGADVDSEELWIAGIIGDSQFGFHGASALGWMTLQGTKSMGTDLHSKTAKILNITRDKAKVFNYARIYGGGVTYASRVIKQHNPELTADDAKSLANDLYKATKGIKTNSREWGLMWHGGSESYMFNALEKITHSTNPRTPVLGCAITKALTSRYVKHRFITSRVNWIVQSSGVDYLHLLIVSMDYLIKKFKIHARFMISVHDEVRYLAAEEDEYRTALALQIANLWTRAMFSYRLGINNLPQGVAFFSAVDIDKYFRKDPIMTCVTPSHEIAFEPAESLTIEQLLEKINSLESLDGNRKQESPEKTSDVKYPGNALLEEEQVAYDKLVELIGLPLCPEDEAYLKAQMNVEKPSVDPRPVRTYKYVNLPKVTLEYVDQPSEIDDRPSEIGNQPVDDRPMTTKEVDNKQKKKSTSPSTTRMKIT